MHAVQALRQRRSASWTHSAIQTLAVQRGVRGSRQDDKEAEDRWRTDTDSDADPDNDSGTDSDADTYSDTESDAGKVPDLDSR